MEVQHIAIGELKLECRLMGNPIDDLIIFLHGFPETSIIWEDLMKHFAELGYYCAAPNMRGYSPNACPTGKKNYSMPNLVNDVANLAFALNKEKFHLVGHDWGAVIGWHTVSTFPDRIISWTALSVPHPTGFGQALKTDPEQKKKSSYIKLFMIPLLPEYKIRKNDFEMFRKVWKKSSTDQVEDYLRIFRNRKCLTAALNYYRANFGSRRPKVVGKITVPTLFLWGKHEKYIGKTAVDNCADHITGSFNLEIIDAGHWLIQENYPEIEKYISKHIQENSN